MKNIGKREMGRFTSISRYIHIWKGKSERVRWDIAIIAGLGKMGFE